MMGEKLRYKTQKKLHIKEIMMMSTGLRIKQRFGTLSFGFDCLRSLLKKKIDAIISARFDQKNSITQMIRIRWFNFPLDSHIYIVEQELTRYSL